MRLVCCLEYIYEFTCFCSSGSRGRHFGSVGSPPTFPPRLESRSARLHRQRFDVLPPLPSWPNQQSRCSTQSFTIPACRWADSRTQPQLNLVFFWFRWAIVCIALNTIPLIFPKKIVTELIFVFAHAYFPEIVHVKLSDKTWEVRMFKVFWKNGRT